MEVLVAIAIIAVVGLAAYTGLQTAIRSTTAHREAGQAEAVLRSAAENLQNPEQAYIPRANCAGVGTYDSLATPPVGFTVDVTGVEFLKSVADVPVSSIATDFDPKCPDSDAEDAGLQLVEITVGLPSGRSEQLHVLKRRNDAAP